MIQAISSKLYDIAFQYARHLSVPVTAQGMKEALEEDPYYPSLYSLCNVFDRLHIPNQALRIQAARLGQLEAPFVTYINEEQQGKDFVLVTNITKEMVTYLVNNNKEKTVSRANFEAGWENIVFVAERTDKSGEANYAKQLLAAQQLQRRKNILIIAGIAILAMVAAVFLFSAKGSTFTALTILPVKLLGLVATVLLLVYDIDKSNSFVKNICSAGKQTNCDAVLNSKAAKFLGMGWGELGFFYFAASTLFLLFPGTDWTIKMAGIAVAATCAAPYIIFSLYYQWKVVKQWCPLCLTVQAVLLLELIWALFSFWQNPYWPAITATTVLAILISIMLPVAVWFTIKPLLIELKASKPYKAAYKRLLYNPEIFNGLLQQKETVAEGYNDLGITIGNPNASNTIVKVCNPYCGPCAQTHPQLEEIVAHNDDVQLKIIFTATNDENDRAAKVVRHLLAIAEKGDPQQTKQALDDWYTAPKKDYEIFAGKYPMNGELKKQGAKIDAMSNWCKEAAIMFTPTIFVNGKQLPENYSVAELQHIF